MIVQKTKRIFSADLLRLVSIFAIVIVHITSGPIYWAKTSDILWNQSMIYDAIFNWGTIVFVMLSGMLMLKPSKTANIKAFLLGRVKRIIIPFIIWYLIYEIYDVVLADKSLSILDLLKNLLSGKVKIHLWFIYMIFALYLITPILSVFINKASKSTVKYFIIYWFIAITIVPLLQHFLEINIKLNNFMQLTSYAGFYVLGYFIHNKNITINKKWFLMIPVLMMLKYFLTDVTSSEVTNHFFRDRLAPNQIIIPILIFMLFRQINWDIFIPEKSKIRKVITSLSNLSYGIFLAHFLIINLLDNNFSTYTINPFKFLSKGIHYSYGFPMQSILVIVLTTTLVWLLSKIPFVKKVMV